jgi:uncharacterized protein YbjT (DUF2867 family)
MSRIFLAGASGVIGQKLIPLLVAQGHQVAGMTRSASKAEAISALGAEPVVCDVFDRDALTQAVVAFAPDVILNELTDLPDDVTRIPAHGELNARIRIEGTKNLIDAGTASGSPKILAQSVAWGLPDETDARSIGSLEAAVLKEGGVVLRYGQFYGAGTYNTDQQPADPRVALESAAEQTVQALTAPSGVLTIVDQY